MGTSGGTSGGTQYANVYPWTIPPDEVGISTSTVPSGANHGAASRVISIGSWSVSKVGLYVATASGNIGVAVWADNGADAPGVLKSQSAAVACPASGLALIPLGATVTVKTGDWIGLLADNVTATFRGWNIGPNVPTPLTVSIAAAPGAAVSNPAVVADARAFCLWGQP